MRVTVSLEQIRSAFEAVKDDPSFDESRGLWERGRPPRGPVPRRLRGPVNQLTQRSGM
jgi:hypothetical protein